MNKNYQKIQNHRDLVKDHESGAILNIDNNALYQYRINKSKKILESKRIDNLENEISELKDVMYQILKEIKK